MLTRNLHGKRVVVRQRVARPTQACHRSVPAASAPSRRSRNASAISIAHGTMCLSIPAPRLILAVFAFFPFATLRVSFGKRLVFSPGGCLS
eukprot:8517355-Pyramimonas_sp.AAC.1